jgi:hypothetical protein
VTQRAGSTNWHEVAIMTRQTSRRAFFKSGVVGGALTIPGLQSLARATEQTSPHSRPSNLKITGVKCGYIRGGSRLFVKILQKAGGLGEGQRIADLANLYYVPFAPHMVASYLGAMASAHVCTSVPNFMVLEWQIYFHRDPMWKEIVDFDGPMVVDGHIPLSEKPGIGVGINEEGMRKYAQEGVPFFE